MIRGRNKAYGEANDERTVTTASKSLEANKFITRPAGSTDRTITTADISARSLLVLDKNNVLASFNYNSSNKLIGTNANGDILAFERKLVPDSPPTGRDDVYSWYGSTQPNGMKIYKSLYLEGPYWYEVIVAGCGGGGGSGAALATNSDLKDGKSGGAGGYYEGTFAVEKGAYCTIEIGCPGGGASGYIVDNTGKTAKLSSGPNGGDGGYTPTLYNGTFTGVDGAKQDLGTRNQAGGIGFAGEADGGDVYGWKSSVNVTGDGYIGAGAGGAAVGEYGGRGGDSGPYGVSDATSGNDKFGYIGGAGGAGAGWGTGGNGGDGWSKASETYGLGGTGYGGGGGGGCANATAAELQSAGCGGGGGGGARFVCGDFEVLCGGGGGGCGGGDISHTHYDGRHSGTDGGNNKNISTGGGGAGGLGGTGLQKDDKITLDTSGTTGSRGYIILRRCT